MSAVWLGGSGAIGAQTARLFVFGLPVLFAGTWIGMELLRPGIDEAAFRKVVLVVVLISGAALMLMV